MSEGKEEDRKKIMQLLESANPNIVTASELSRLEYEIKELAAQFVSEYHEYPIPKDECDHPDFADVDCDEYNYCKLCGRSWDV